MKPHKLLYLAIFASLAVLILQCEKQPAKPEYDNPLDPGNPATGGDPFALTAEIGGGGVQLWWQAVTSVGSMEGYNIYRKIDADSYLLLMEISGNTVNSYIDSDISNGHSYSYYIVARDTAGLESVSNTAVVDVNSQPVLSIDDTGGYTPSRTVNLTMLAFGAAKMQIGTPDLTGAVWVDYAATSSIQLSTGEGMKIVQARFAYPDGDTSVVTSDTTFPMAMDASFNIENGAQYTETREVAVFSSAQGQNLSMKMSEDSTFAGLDWSDFADSSQFVLSTGEGVKTVYIRFRNDFEAESGILQDSIEPQAMNPSFNIAHNAQYTPSTQVWLFPTVTGANIQCKFSENSGFTGALWQDYADSASFTLSSGAGAKTVYAKFMNDFEVESGVVSDQIAPSPLSPVVNIEPDSTYINYFNVNLSMPDVGAIHMKLSTTADSSTVLWQAYTPTQNNFILGGTDGLKKVYAWFRNDFFAAGPAMDSVFVDTYCEVDTFYWESSAGDTLYPFDEFGIHLIMKDDNIGREYNGEAFVVLDSILVNYPLTDNYNGSYSASYTIQEGDSINNGNFILSFTDRAGNIVQQHTSSNPITICWFPAGYIRTFPLGNTGLNIEMVWIPPGSFMQGGYSGEVGLDLNENPQHLVTINYGFWMGKYEVTQPQWEIIMGDWTFSFDGYPNRPAENLSWDDISDFLFSLNNLSGDDIWRLPSESEWEYACRAGTTTRYYWGDDLTYGMIWNYAWYNLNSDGHSHDVGGKFPNNWNLFDMSGNIYEWCEDYMHSNYIGAPTNGSSWLTPIDNKRVARGGSWFAGGAGYGYNNCRSASRASYDQSLMFNHVGFRLVRNP